MPSRLRKKTNVKKHKKGPTKPTPSPPYTEEQMRTAVQQVLEGKPVAAAARDNHVPRTSLLYKAKGLRPLERKMGPKTILTFQEEKFIENWIVSISKAGFPITKVELLDSVQRILGELQRENPFIQNRPGRKWLECFLKRHPSVTLRTPQNLTNSRASIKPEQILEWSSAVYNYLVENDYAQILHNPMRVFNADESAFFLCPKGEKVLAQKGNKTVYQYVNNDEKECITVLVTANAAGQFAPPLLVFKYERIPREILDGVDPSYGIGKSESGWMTGATFYEFITNVFHPWLEKEAIQRPIILFIDGHVSHMTLHTSDFCSEHGIILIALLPNATHLLQPMDVAVFRSLKGRWSKRVHKWRSETMESRPVLKKKDFAPLFKDVLKELDPSIVANGFKTCGLVPWDPNLVVRKLQGETINNRDENVSLHQAICNLATIETLMGKEKVEQFKFSQVAVRDESLFLLWKEVRLKARVEVPDGRELDPESNSAFDLNTSKSVDVSSSSASKETVTSNCVNLPSTSATINTVTTLNKAVPDVPSPSNSIDVSSSSAHKETVTSNCVNLPSTSATINTVTTPNKAAPEVPSPFKRAFLWPGPQPSKKRGRRQVLPSVVTSQTWREYNTNKTVKKLVEQEAKARRADERKKKKDEREQMKRKKSEEKASMKKKKTTQKKRKNKRSVSSSSSEEEWVPSDVSIADQEGVGGSPGSNFNNEEDILQSSEPGNGIDERNDMLMDPHQTGHLKNLESYRSTEITIDETFNLDGLDIMTDEGLLLDDLQTEDVLQESDGLGSGHVEVVQLIQINETREQEVREDPSENQQYPDRQREKEKDEGEVIEAKRDERRKTQLTPEASNKENQIKAPKSEDCSAPDFPERGGHRYTQQQAKEGSFIIAVMKKKKMVCQILSFEKDCTTVQTFIPASRIGNVFKITKNINAIAKDQIVDILPQPFYLGTGCTNQIQFLDAPLLS